MIPNIGNFFDLTAQKTFLSMALQDDKFLERIPECIDPDYFTNNTLQTLFALIKTYHQRHGTPPSKKRLRRLIESSKSIKIKERREHFKLVNHLFHNPDARDAQFLLDELPEITMRMELARQLLSGSEAVMDTEANPSQIIENIAATSKYETLFSNEGIDTTEAITEILKSRESYAGREVPIGIKTIDKVLFGGVRPPEMLVVMAGTNKGKTSFMCQMAALNMKRGLDVVYFSFENTASHISARYLANLFRMSDREIRFSETEDSMRELYTKYVTKKKRNGNVNVVFFPMATINPAQVYSYCERYQRRKQRKIGLLIIDYVDLLLPPIRDVSGHEGLKEIYKHIKGIAGRMDMPVVTGSQVKVESLKSGIVRLHSAGGAIAKMEIVDSVLGMEFPEECEGKIRIPVKFRLLKYRGGPANIWSLCNMNLETTRLKETEHCYGSDDNLPREVRQGERDKFEKKMAREKSRIERTNDDDFSEEPPF